MLFNSPSSHIFFTNQTHQLPFDWAWHFQWRWSLLEKNSFLQPLKSVAPQRQKKTPTTDEEHHGIGDKMTGKTRVHMYILYKQYISVCEDILDLLDFLGSHLAEVDVSGPFCGRVHDTLKRTIDFRIASDKPTFFFKRSQHSQHVLEIVEVSGSTKLQPWRCQELRAAATSRPSNPVSHNRAVEATNFSSLWHNFGASGVMVMLIRFAPSPRENSHVHLNPPKHPGSLTLSNGVKPSEE